MKIKTSTRVSTIFSIFTFFIILSLLIVLNTYLFFSWYNKEIDELKESNILTDIINDGYKEIIGEELKEDENNELLKGLLNLELFEGGENNLEGYEKLFLDLYSKDNQVYLLYQKDDGKYYSPYNVTRYYNEQIKIIKIGLILLVLFTLLSFIISKRIFIKLALKDIFYISKEIKNIDLNNIKKISLNLDKNDEINTIGDSVNNFLDIIEKNNKSLKQFNSQVAHEFKTPLMVISSELEFLDLKGSKSESMKRIEFQISKLDSLLEHFLLLTKIGNLKTLKKEEVVLKKIIDKNISNLEKIYFDKNIKILNKVAKNIKIKTNKEFLGIIIKNILDNAFKYNKNGGKIKISFENNTLKIEDSGKGIKKENLDKIWNNLYRENEFGKGYGVGLNLVKKISDVLGYKVRVESKERKGTIFLLKVSNKQN